MNYDGRRVVFRTNNKFVSASLEVESQQAFAVIYVNEPKATSGVVIRHRMKLEIQFLQKINESEYLYQTLVELPGPAAAGPVMGSRESDHDSRRECFLPGP